MLESSKYIKYLLLQITMEENANTTFVLGFNYAFLTLDLPGNWIHTWEKAVSNLIKLHTSQSKCGTVKPNKL